MTDFEASAATQARAAWLAAHARIGRLLDPGSAIELGLPDHGCIVRGTMQGWPVLVQADLPGIPASPEPGQDAPATRTRGSARSRTPGGPPTPTAAFPTAPMMATAPAMAAALGIPFVRLLLPVDDIGTGPPADDGAAPMAAPGDDDWAALHALLAQVPVITLLASPHTTARPSAATASRDGQPDQCRHDALDALRLLCSHVALAVSHAGAAGPARSHLPVDIRADDDDEAFASVRQAIACLQRQPAAAPPVPQDPGVPGAALPPRDRRVAWNPRELLAAVLDAGTLLELGPEPATALCTGFARVDGVAVVVIAGDDREHAPLWHAQHAQRGLRMLRLATTFGLPVVLLVDGPGVAAGALPALSAEAAEPAATDALRAIAALRAALSVPGLATCTLATRTWYADAPGAQRRAGVQLRYAWPSALRFELDDATSAAALAALLATTPDPAGLRDDIEAIRAPARAAQRALEQAVVDALVAPADTRRRLQEFVALVARGVRRHPP